MLLGFAIGVWWLQQQAQLPDLLVCCGLAFIAFSAGWMARRRFGVGAFVLAAVVAGFAYAALRAEIRMRPHLPAGYEQRDIELTGFVRGLPEPQAQGVRFLFEVEANGAGLRDFPNVVRLFWAPAAPAAVPALHAGQRWTLTARLKRPHANANFSLRDGEVSLLERGIRATGSVSLAHAPRRLSGDAIGPWLAIDRWRDHVRHRIEAVLGGAPHRGIIVALAVGAQEGISNDDWAIMRATGTSHLVAISGLHIGFVAGLAALACGFVWRRISVRGLPGPLLIATPKFAALGAASFAAVYAALAGFNVPAQRTLWMLTVLAVAFVCGRRPASSLVLAWALALVVVVDPWAVTSPGFWLSFCAVAAILHAIAANGRRVTKARADDENWLAGMEARDAVLPDEDVAGRGKEAVNVVNTPNTPNTPNTSAIQVNSDARDSPVQSDALATSRDNTSVPSEPNTVSVHLARRIASACRHAAFKLRAHIASGARVQYAVTLALAPLTAYWFFQVPLIGPLANAFAIPWISFVVTPATLAGLILPAPVDAPAFHLAHAALSVLCDALKHLADAGPAWSLWRLAQPQPFALAAALGAAAWALAPRGWPLRFAAPLSWLPLLAPAPHAIPPGAFRITALDIGQGSALVVETAKRVLLFDAGPGPESTHAGERITAPYLIATGTRMLDALVISHSDSDHAGGAAALLQSIAVRQLLASLPADDALWSNAARRGSDTVRCAAGQHWTWDGVDFRMLWPDPGPLTGKPNHQACVLKITNAAGRSALFTADIEADVERTLIERDRSALRADVLIVPHHGSRTSSTEPFLDSVEPMAAVFQVGYRNRFHHPNPTVHARYRMRGIALSRSDEDGAARIDMGADIVLERYRQTHARYWMDHPRGGA